MLKQKQLWFHLLAPGQKNLYPLIIKYTSELGKGYVSKQQYIDQNEDFHAVAV